MCIGNEPLSAERTATRCPSRRGAGRFPCGRPWRRLTTQMPFDIRRRRPSRGLQEEVPAVLAALSAEAARARAAEGGSGSRSQGVDPYRAGLHPACHAGWAANEGSGV